MNVLHAEGTWDSPMMAGTRPEEELYDLRTDPHEMKNLADNPDYAEKLAELREMVNDWIAETGDTGAIDESQTVDMEELMKSKWKYYTNSMKRRGLDPGLSEREYLQWWQNELRVE